VTTMDESVFMSDFHGPSNWEAALSELSSIRKIPLKWISVPHLIETVLRQVPESEMRIEHLQQGSRILSCCTKGGIGFDAVSCAQADIDYPGLMAHMFPGMPTSDVYSASRETPGPSALPVNSLLQLNHSYPGAGVGMTKCDHVRNDETVVEITPQKKRGRPCTISNDRKEKALTAQKNGVKGKALARILYATNFPTERQCRNVYSILKHYATSKGRCNRAIS